MYNTSKPHRHRSKCANLSLRMCYYSSARPPVRPPSELRWHQMDLQFQDLHSAPVFWYQRWKKWAPFEASITPKHVRIQIILPSYVFLIYKKGRTYKCHLIYLVPSLTNYLTSRSYLYLAIMVQMPIITEGMCLIYVLIFGRTEFIHLLNWLSSKRLSGEILLFPLEILKFYHQMSFMNRSY